MRRNTKPNPSLVPVSTSNTSCHLRVDMQLYTNIRVHILACYAMLIRYIQRYCSVVLSRFVVCITIKQSTCNTGCDHPFLQLWAWN